VKKFPREPQGAGATPIIIAHRGAAGRGLAPENTLPAFELAFRLGADACECDVRTTHDGHLVVFHDEDTARLTRGIHTRKISDAPLADLTHIDVGQWKHQRYEGTRIPRLREVIHMLPKGKKLFIELKSPGLQPVLTLVDEIKSSGEKRERLSVIGFDLRQMTVVKKLLNNTPVLWLCGICQDETIVGWDHQARSVDEVIHAATYNQVDGINLHAASGPLPGRLIAAAKRACLKTCAWIVNNPAQARRLAALGLDALTTDQPGRIRSIFRLPHHPPTKNAV